MSKEDPVVWVCFPTANDKRAEEAILKWDDMGYETIILGNDNIDPLDRAIMFSKANYFHNEYKGYWWACNLLVDSVFDWGYKQADLVVLAADDMDPDPNKTAQELANEYFERFPEGEGLMQPCGDRQGGLIDGKWASQRICGSPWFGRGWYERGLFEGKPTPEMFFHFYGDELLKDVSEALGLLWMREDVTQLHHHWSWGHGKQEAYQARNSNEHWKKDQETYLKVKEEYIEKAKASMGKV